MVLSSLSLSLSLSVSLADHALYVLSGCVARVEVRVQVVLPQDLWNELVAADADARPLSRLEETAQPQVSATDFHLSLHSAVFVPPCLSLIALHSRSQQSVKLTSQSIDVRKLVAHRFY